MGAQRALRPYCGVVNMANQQVAEHKPSRFATTIAPVREYFRDTLGELRKVHWPSREEVRNLTVIVLAVTFAMGMVLGLFDFIFEQVFFGILKPNPDIVAVASLAVIVLAIVVIVVYAGRERR
jgi:preprotein translocase subunit SecE